MKLFRGAVDTIKRVYRYEKTTGMDVGALQGVMLIFAVVLFLIDIENFRLGKYVIGIVTLVVGTVSVTAVFVIRRFQKVVLVCRIAVFLFLLLAAAILYAGANDGFSLLWYLLLPVITLMGLRMGGMLGGSVFVENVFVIPGMGSLLVNAISMQDIPLIQGCVLLIALFTSVVNLITDIIYVLVDPRIKIA